jgi:ribonuclease P protein component
MNALVEEGRTLGSPESMVHRHLPQSARHHLRTRAEFERVRREGRSWSHRLLILAACRNELQLTRVGMMASRSVGGAVERNRARRLMREAWRIYAAHIVPGWDALLIARKAITQVKMQEVAAALESLLHQARLVS